MTIRLSWVTNIPTPYRNHRYERMSEIFPRLGIELEVQFMAWNEPARPWRYKDADLSYPHRVHGGLRPARGADVYYVNPGLIWRSFRGDENVVVVGGWASPSAILVPFAVRSRTLRLLESESNVASSRLTRGPARWLKQCVIRRYDGFIGPGPRSRELLGSIDPGSLARPFLEFPNLIDKSVFGDGVARQRRERSELRAALGLSGDVALWVCPARLETFKGLHLFLPLLEGMRRVLLVVCGEGSLRGELQSAIDARKLPVRLVGQKSEPEMVRLYAAADLFVLPSLRDPSPLSPIEACAASLPILASRWIGNFEDVIEEGKNGWGYDPGRPEGNRETVARIAATPIEELAAMGARSRELYDRRFDSDTCVRRVGEGILELHRRHSSTR